MIDSISLCYNISLAELACYFSLLAVDHPPFAGTTLPRPRGGVERSRRNQGLLHPVSVFWSHNNENRAASFPLLHHPYSRQGPPSKTVAVSATIVVPPHLSLHSPTPQELGTRHPAFTPRVCSLFWPRNPVGPGVLRRLRYSGQLVCGRVSAPTASVGISGQWAAKRVPPSSAFGLSG